MAMLPKIIAIAGGTGWATLAQIAGNEAFSNQPVHIYGGWGVAVLGLGLLWKDNKALREEARQDRVRFDAERKEREAIADVKDEKYIRSMQTFTTKLEQIHDIQQLGCPSRLLRPESMKD